MRNQILGAGAALAAVLLAGSPAAAAVTFEKAVFSGAAHAHAVGITDEGSTTVTALPSATLEQNHQSYASAHGSGAVSKSAVTFADAANGEVDFTDLHASAHWLGEYPPGANTETELRYTFTVDTSSLLRLTYDTDFDDEHMGLYYSLYETPGKQTQHEFQPGAGFIFTDAFGPGTYTLRISAYGLATSSPTVTDQKTHLTGSVGFSVLPNGRQPTSAAPEPATWALLIGGFGMAGGAMRRRRGVSV